MTHAPGRDIARLIAGQVCVHATMSGTRMAVPLLALHQGHGKMAVGVLVALFALAQVAMSFPAGKLADRSGLKLPLACSVVAACMGVGLAAAWPVYAAFCLAALLSGGAIATSSIALQRHVGRLAQDAAQLKRTFSWVSMAPAAANALGPAIAGAAIDVAGYRAAFVVLALLPVITWLLARTATEARSREPHAESEGSVLSLLRQPGMRPLLVMNLFVSASWDLHGFMVPLLGYGRGLQASVIGLVMAAFAGGAAASRLGMPFIAAQVREARLITGAVLVTGVLLLAYPFAVSAWAMGACSVLLGVALGCVQPLVMSLLYEMSPPHRRGEVLAVRLIMVNASAVSMPLLLGASSALLGASGVFWFMGAVVAVGSTFGRALRHIPREVD